MRFVGSLVLATLLACGASDHGAETAGDAGSAGPAPGYVRFVTKAVTVPANTSSQWLQWVQAPMDHDVDIADIQGSQSAGGHHAVLYSTSDVEPVGTLKSWKDADITTSHFLGGIGGEGGSALRLPAGAVFRLKAGQALALQAHYLNASAQPLQGTTQLDVKFADRSPSDRLVSLLTNTALTFNVPAQAQGHVDISCTLTRDASILMFTNHMHQWGTSALTQLVDTAGTTSVLRATRCGTANGPRIRTSPRRP
jgi:hypothetical protein